MMRPNVIANYRPPWHAGLGLRMENDRENIEPRYLPPVHIIKPAPPVHKTPVPPVHVNTTRHIPRPIVHPTIKPPVPKQPPPPPTCQPGFAWDGTKCIPSGTQCNAPMVLDAAGNCALPPGTQCPTGWSIDASGNCTADERNPYSLYLPDTGAGSSQAGGAGAPAAVLPTCASGNFDAQGNCIPPTIWDWFKESTLIPGVENMWVAGGGALAAYLMFFHKSGGRK